VVVVVEVVDVSHIVVVVVVGGGVGTDTSSSTCVDQPEYRLKVSLSDRTSNTYVLSRPPVFSKILKGRVYSVFRAVSSPTFPVATPQPPPGGMRKDMAYLSGSTLPVLGASQSR